MRWGRLISCAGRVRTVDYERVIKRENKYFIFVKHLSRVSAVGCGLCRRNISMCFTCNHLFMYFQASGSPMTLVPTGALAACNQNQEFVAKAEKQGPVCVKQSLHEGSSFVVTYAAGSVAQVRHEHADRYQRKDLSDRP